MDIRGFWLDLCLIIRRPGHRQGLPRHSRHSHPARTQFVLNLGLSRAGLSSCKTKRAVFVGPL